MQIPGYGSIYNLGHKAIRDLFNEPVVVQEKVDGSQISFRRPADIDAEDDGSRLQIRSKGSDLHLVAPDKMFKLGIDEIAARYSMLTPGWVYRGEYLMRPKHNALAYDRVPRGNIILFDVDRGGENYLTPDELAREAARIDLESVPVIYRGVIDVIEVFRTMLERTSVLGGQKVEGVVAKNYERFTVDKKIMMGKFVSEAFKEVHQAEWKENNPGRKDILQFLVAKYRTPARWAKAVQHLREAGKILDAPQDIGMLFREVPDDVQRECESEMRDALWAFFWPELRRGITAGMAEWYKQVLLERQFNAE